MALDPTVGEKLSNKLAVDADGKILISGGSITLTASDLEIGAVEIKNATTDDRLTVDASGRAYVDLRTLGGTAIDTNSGVKSAGTQRVVLATDQPALNNALDQNLTKVGGTAIDTNSGNKSAGTQRIVLATDQPNLTTPLNVNKSQVGGTAVDTNSGNKSAGTQRVVLATDQPVVPVSDNAGSLTVDAPLATPVFSTLTPNTTGGWSSFLATTSDGATALTNSAQAIKGSAGTFGGYYIYNPNTSAIYVHVYNVASGGVTVGTTNPQLTFCIPASSGANVEFTNGINFSTAMSCSATTTGGGNSAPSTALEAVFIYK